LTSKYEGFGHLSTIVDNLPPTRRRIPAAATREKILHAARRDFSRAGFDHVGLRDVAAAAGTDAKIVLRLFGSKEALFDAVAAGAFDLEPSFLGPVDRLGERIARHLLQPMQNAEEGFDAFQFLLRSASNPITAPILSRHLQEGFVAPLAALISGRDAPARAALVTACILGFSTLRFALALPIVDTVAPEMWTANLGRIIQTAIDGETG
jgi:AcrR family transcriptional regulator